MSINPIINYLKGHFQKNSVNVIEIGARYGESSKVLLNNLNVNKYIIIDPYTSYDEYSNDGFNKIILNDNDDNIFHKTKNELETLHNNMVFYRTFSTDTNTINAIENDSIDIIFIDGNHTYKYVLDDLENYYPKLKQNGIICGDDFFMRTHENDNLNTMPGNQGYDEPMVYEAVIEFCKRHNKSYTEFGKHRGYGKIFMINN
jgi:predicted O-methyltransferase YrrM